MALVVQWLSLREVAMTIRVQILEEAVCVSHSVNTLRYDSLFSMQLWVNSWAEWAL